MIKLSVIVVNYNVKDYLKRALLSIQKSLQGIPSEVFVVDNGSGDGSTVLVEKEFPWIRLIANDHNVGFAKANNQAMRQAKGEVVCLINPDTLVREDTFRVSLDYLLAHEDVGALGCKVMNPDGTLQLSCRRSIPTPWVALTKVTGLSALFPKSRFFGKYNLTYLDPDKIAEVEALSGSFMLVRRKTIEDVGYLDEAFFMYGEDLDWCYRIGKKGWKIIYLPATQIIHYKGQSTKEASFDQLLLFYEAMRLFVRKHFRKGWSFLPLWFLLLGIRIRSSLSLLFRLLKRASIPAVDVLFIQAALALAFAVRFQKLNYSPDYRLIGLIYSLVWIACLYFMGAYEKGRYSSSRAMAGVLAGLVLNTSITFFFPQYAYSRQVALMVGGFNVVSLGGWRLAIRLVSRFRGIPFFGTIGRTLMRRRVLIAGTDPSGQKLYDHLADRIDAGYEVVGFLRVEENPKEMVHGKAPVLGGLKDLKRVVRAHGIREVIFSPETVHFHRIFDVMAEARALHLDFKMVPKDSDVLMGKTSIDYLDNIPLIDLEYRIYSVSNGFLKRAMDVVVSSLFLPLTLGVMLGVALHPSYTMVRKPISDGMGECQTIMSVMKKGGKKVKCGVCKLPLLLNVLQGGMSLVGMEMRPFSEDLPVQGFKPGLTSLVHVQSRDGLTEEEKHRYQHYYLKHYSLLLDMEIILRSIFKV